MLAFTQRAMAPDIPWRQIVATHNRFAHASLGIAPETVWSILAMTCRRWWLPCQC
ncbi:DUF86 domain-containing protein [Ideonella sp. 4Y11]|uniref:DUF86 domain-containing protein n=1 Tax=Ideonella aquatica TaxID=2824119 RepID=A0A941BIX9_9BURK|nr:HepT-like ribonuclease domain-containing protein [Ideonella aquatica]MBQ0959022.1 DUF86 domain-containing protein [Ideonella aquatica]